MAADCKSADVSLRGCESLPSLPTFFFTQYFLIKDCILAIEFYNEYISIVMEANLSSSEEIAKFVEDSDEACNIRMPVVVLDMKNVREINSAGIAKMLKLYKNLQSLKVKLFMINLHESVTPILKSLMIFSLIKYFDDPKDFLL